MSRRLQALQAAFRKSFAKIDLRAIAERVRQLPDEAERIGDAGWTLPMWATPAEVRHILEEARKREIDDVFLEYYEAYDCANYVQLKRHLDRPSLARWSALIEQCFTAYEAESCLVVVPAMITVVEGSIAHVGGPDAWKKPDPKQAVEKLLAQSSSDSIEKAIWSSIHRFVLHLFDSKSFSGTRPTRINRHWILHGRDDPSWSRADCLRLFQAADTIGS